MEWTMPGWSVQTKVKTQWFIGVLIGSSLGSANHLAGRLGSFGFFYRTKTCLGPLQPELGRPQSC
jgi:hypothetical protein